MAIDYLDELKKSNTKALRYFIDKYEVKLAYFCSKFVRNPEISDEIICDTFHKLWVHKDKISSLLHLENFLFKTTKNACINTATRNKECHNVQLDITKHDKSDEHDIHQEIVLAELMEILYQEIDKLPPQQAVIFKMSFLEGLSTEEICERLNTTQNNVFNSKSLALKTLRKVFNLKNLDILTVIYMLTLNSLTNKP